VIARFAKLFGLTAGPVILGALASNATATGAEADLALSYSTAAAKWSEALPLGNGRLGAMVFGGTESERIQINESTLWGGTPHDYSPPEAAKSLTELRQRIFAGDIRGAEKLGERLMGQPKLLAPYQPCCDLRIHFPGHAVATDYHRGLQLDEAVSTVSYRVDGVSFHREVFASHPDQVLVIRLTADQPGKQTFSIGMDSPQPGARVHVAGVNAIHLSGQIQPRRNPLSSWVGSWDAPGMKFAADLLVQAEGGTVHSAGEQLEVVGADAVTVLFSNATAFKSYTDIGGDANGEAIRRLRLASGHSYEQLRRRHVDDFQELFSRVHLQLGGAVRPKDTHERLQDFNTTNDPGLAALYYQFARYLLIASSRPGGQPANLQGIWNADLLPAWGSKWTTNINLQMNYWPAETGNLWDTEGPLWSMIGELRVTGAETARTLYNSRGWVLHHNTDLWRATAPVDGPWGLWPVGGVWLSNQMWDHYEFSQDREFLRRQAYPAMREAARFVLDTLVPAPAGTPFAGKLVTNPSVSPENQYLLNGARAHLTYAPSMDIELISELFDNCQRASETLGVDADLRSELQRAQRLLPPLQIGKHGALQEWIEDYDEAEPDHRHTSHLYALYPGSGIDLERTPQLAAAARKTLELRGDGSTGWSKAWRIALWARLRDGEHAYGILRSLILSSTLPNLFDVGPPFQIDGNFGGAAGIAEMLLQSGHGEIVLLPALPRAWKEGVVAGLRARGGATVGFEWHNGRLTSVSIHSDAKGRFRIRYEAESTAVDIQPGRDVVLDGSLRVR